MIEHDSKKGGITEKEALGRRRLLKQISVSSGAGALAASGALPTQWAKPVVDSIILPAHAQTSVLEEDDDGGGCSGFQVSTVNDNSGNTAQIAGNNTDSISFPNGMMMMQPELFSFTTQICSGAEDVGIDLNINWMMVMAMNEMFTALTDASGVATFQGMMMNPLSMVNADMNTTATATLSFNTGTPADTVVFDIDFTA